MVVTNDSLAAFPFLFLNFLNFNSLVLISCEGFTILSFYILISQLTCLSHRRGRRATSWFGFGGFLKAKNVRAHFKFFIKCQYLGPVKWIIKASCCSRSSDAFVGAESNIHTRTAEASSGAAHTILSGQRSSSIGSSDPKRVVSHGRNSSHVKNYDTALGHGEFAVRE